jgi:hypothetical protein
MSRVNTRYTLPDFVDYKNSMSIIPPLPQETIDIINKISVNVGAPEYNRTPHFNNNNNKKIKHTIKEASIDEWNNIRNFKSTVLEKKQGIDASIDKIRKFLNKITDKTYDKMVLNIIDEIEYIIKNNDFKDDDKPMLITSLQNIGDSIFDIASGNSFYSKIYAKLFKELMERYDFMIEIFNKKINSTEYILNDFIYCSPDKDYDQFCKNNKSNEKRRSLGLFYTNLMLEKIVDSDKIFEMIQDVQKDLFIKIKQDDSSNIVDEMSELLYIMITNGVSILKTNKIIWSDINERVLTISKMKHKSEPSISNKTIFKHMDILLFIDKLQ